MLIEPDVTALTDTPVAFEAENETPLFNYEQALHDCASGDRQALHRLYRQEASRLLGVALRIVRQRQQAEDIVHDAFVAIWSKAATFNAALGSGRGWV